MRETHELMPLQEAKTAIEEKEQEIFMNWFGMGTGWVKGLASVR